MLVYHKGLWGIPLLLRGLPGGSPVTRCLLFPLLSSLQTLCIFQFTCQGVSSFDRAIAALSLSAGVDASDGTGTGKPRAGNGACSDGRWMLSPFPYQLFASFLGFVVIFRCNHSLTRFWEARTSVAAASAKWSEALMQLFLLDEGVPEAAASDADADAQRAAGLAWRARAVHLASLLHAVAFAHLRDDLDVRNLPPLRNARLDAPESAPESAPAEQAVADSSDDLESGGSGAAPAPRCVHACAPRRQVKITWVGAEEHDAGKAFRAAHPLHNVFRYTWGVAANRLCAAAVPLPVLGGVGDGEAAALGATPERVRLVAAWLHRAVARRAATRGGLAIAVPPGDAPAANSGHISRVAALLADGVAAWVQARKIVETPFPFPHAHLVSIALLVFAFTAPLVMVSWTASVWAAVLMDFLAVMVYFALNEIAKDLEDPFVGPPNAIPLAHLHASFHEEILSYGADAVALLQTDAVAAAAACALDASSEAGAAAMQRALGAGGTGSGRAVVSGSTYGVMHRRLLRDAKGDSATADDEEAPPSPRQGIMRFFA